MGRKIPLLDKWFVLVLTLCDNHIVAVPLTLKQITVVLKLPNSLRTIALVGLLKTFIRYQCLVEHILCYSVDFVKNVVSICYTDSKENKNSKTRSCPQGSYTFELLIAYFHHLHLGNVTQVTNF